ncbi:hypothetical protein PhCBS80983_g00590 [Powellomyces hirtus]|uniref:non-specific serine/threonine protein kinase n=1 Tax=Powellomyces hirtus TaxID=109895 RepID=A0A507EFV3_9FUNG|nr:hypothetical protein PhCBS80983_g00590 [Powellomyces hirtus]
MLTAVRDGTLSLQQHPCQQPKQQYFQKQRLGGGPMATTTTNETGPCASLEGIVVHRRWRILHLLGKGAFGLVHAALDTHTHTQVAIKIEPPSAKKQVLRLEIAVLKKLAASSATPSPWVADFIAAGKFAVERSAARGKERGVGGGVYSYLVMRLLGPNLSDIRRTTPTHRFSLTATSHLAVQMLHALETLHGVGIVHRDVKPGNFCLETARTTTPPSSALDCARIYIIDFGLSRRYLSTTDNAVLPARSKVGFRGTSRYASPRAHAGLDLSPVDDLWSLFYVVVECVTGSLPWKGREKSRIAEIKQLHHGVVDVDDGGDASGRCGFAHITEGLPAPLVRLWRYLSALEYGDRVDYAFVERVFVELGGGGCLSLDGAASQEVDVDAPAYPASTRPKTSTTLTPTPSPPKSKTPTSIATTTTPHASIDASLLCPHNPAVTHAQPPLPLPRRPPTPQTPTPPMEAMQIPSFIEKETETETSNPVPPTLPPLPVPLCAPAPAELKLKHIPRPPTSTPPPPFRARRYRVAAGLQ